MSFKEIQQRCRQLANPKDAKFLQGFFKTGPGDYGEGDVFHGIRVPVSRKIARDYKHADLATVEQLLESKFHEERMIALFILTYLYEQSNPEQQSELCDYYLTKSHRINNWDLVDCSAHKILGNYLLKRNKQIIYDLSHSESLWEKRIAIVSTWTLIRDGQLQPTLRICKTLLTDEHDLIHKACGWMLRELGKKEPTLMESFLGNYYKKMPRTMLRYAIEKLPQAKRKAYLQGKV